MHERRRWIILIYKIPSQPTRLRLQAWRRLQRMGVLYLQDAVCLLPADPEHVENMQYVAAEIEEMGGSGYLFESSALLPASDADIVSGFRQLANARLDEIVARLDALQASVDPAEGPSALERYEGDLKRERVAYLRARKLSFFGSDREQDVDRRLDALKGLLDDLYRSEK